MIDLVAGRGVCPSVPSSSVPSKSFLALMLTAGLALGAVVPLAAQQEQTPQTSTQSQRPKSTRPIHIVPFVTQPPEGTEAHRTESPLLSTHLDYYGGPVASNVQIVLVYWGANVNSELIAKLPGFYQAVTNSTYFDLLSEYSTNVTPVGGGSGTNQSIGRGSYLKAVQITPSIGDCPPTCNLADSEIQAEIEGQINAGNLPAPEYDNNGNVNTEYAVYFPPGANITDPNGAPSCQSGGFCAYHGTGILNSKNLAYGIFPDFYVGGCSQGCGEAIRTFDNVTSVSSHEMAETVTDTAVGLATQVAPPLAWYDTTNGEIGDICNQQEATITIGGTAYTVQKLWSNNFAECVIVGLHPAYQLSAPGTAAAGAPFTFTLTALNPAGGLGTDTAYSGTVQFGTSDGGAGVSLPADYTFTSSDQGTHTFSATLGTSGAQTITATDSVNGAITATASINVTAAPTPTTTSLATSQNPSVYGQGVTFSANVTPTGGGTPTGTVTFADGNNTLAVTPVSGGQAAVTLTSLAVGTHSIVANYSGDARHLASGSGPLTETITGANTTTSLAASANPAVVGQPITYTATVTGQYLGMVTGSVTFKAGTSMLGAATLVNGQASLDTSFGSAGARYVTATYVGDANNVASTSLRLQQLVNKSPSSTAVLSDLNPSNYGQQVTLTAAVTCNITPTGNMTFKYGRATLAKVRLSGGSASLPTTTLGAGADAITAVYGGDAHCSGSTSPVLEQVVNIAATTTSLGSSPNPSTAGQSVTLTATLSSSAGTPTGKVKFTSGATSLGTVTLSAGVATLTTSKLPLGSDTITANYLGTQNYATSSASVTQTVQ